MEAQNNQVAIIHNSIEVFKSAPEILRTNQERSAKAMIVGGDILEQWRHAWAIENEDQRMSALAAADDRSNKYLVNCTSALQQEKESRAAITQMMDAFKKMFFDAEADIDREKPGTPANKIQEARNNFAKAAAQVAARKRKEAEDRAAKAQEVITLKATIEKAVFNAYNDYLRANKMGMNEKFNSLNLSDFEEKSQKLRDYKPVLLRERLVIPATYGSYHSPDEIMAFQTEIFNAAFPEYAANYSAELSILRDELIDKLPSKKAELEDQKRLDDEAEELRQKNLAAKTLEENKQHEKRMEELKKMRQDQLDVAKKRQQDEQRKIDEQAITAKANLDLQVDIKSQGEQTMVMFTKEAEIATPVNQAQVTQGYTITVLHQVGYTQIFQLWFNEVGKDMDIEKLDAVKLETMKRWCEKQAAKGTLIDSKFIKYEESFKAVARKSKVS